MGAVIEGGELVVDLVAGPFLLAAHAAGVVVGQHACPHEVPPGVVVHGIGHGLGSGLHDGLHQRLAEAVRETYVGGGGKVPLADVGEHIHRAAGGLIGREGAGEPGIQDGEAGPHRVGPGDAPFEVPFLFCDDAAAASLAAGGGDGEHRANRQGLCGHIGAAVEDIPEVPVVHCAKGDGLGGVDDAAAAQGQDEVQILLPDQINALIDLAAAGVGLNAGELHKGKARFL